MLYLRNTNKKNLDDIWHAYFERRKLTSPDTCRLSQTLVPLIRDTCRSDVSPPNMTKTLRKSSCSDNGSLSFEEFDFLGVWFESLQYEARLGNRKQARLIMVLRIFEWEKPT